MRIGLLGVQCDTANLGLAALAYSAAAIVDSIDRNSEIVMFSVNSDRELTQMCSVLGIERERVRAIPFRHKQPKAMLNSFRAIRRCDLIIDFTGGDSFSDIYGTMRLFRKLFHKQLVLWAKTPLVLAPQTYGPLGRKLLRHWYRHVVERAALVFTRDQLSEVFLRGLSPRPVIVATDVAVKLPWVPRTSAGAGVGLNVSGLLWAGGYTGNNQFGLATHYRDWCREVAEGLINQGYEVWLVPHVLTRPGERATEDDVAASAQLRALVPQCRMAPHFGNPVEAKSWISGLEMFIGSRMHATIASFTSGVPTIPVAYSRKFAGFFGNLGSDILVDLSTLDTRQAAESTLALAQDGASLRRGSTRAEVQIERFTRTLAELIGTTQPGQPVGDPPTERGAHGHR